jgi:hypothetical protein
MATDLFSRASQILDVLRDIELSVAQLYRGFSSSFPPDRVLWEDLARDEVNHAAMVEELKNALLKNGSPFELGQVNIFTLATFRTGIEGYLHRLERGELQRRHAFFIARDFENTLIENGFYYAVVSENKDYQTIQGKIQKETLAHLQRLENYIQTIFP